MFMFVICEDLRSYAYSVSNHAWLSVMTFDYKNWKKKKNWLGEGFSVFLLWISIKIASFSPIKLDVSLKATELCNVKWTNSESFARRKFASFIKCGICSLYRNKFQLLLHNEFIYKEKLITSLSEKYYL